MTSADVFSVSEPALYYYYILILLLANGGNVYGFFYFVTFTTDVFGNPENSGCRG